MPANSERGGGPLADASVRNASFVLGAPLLIMISKMFLSPKTQLPELFHPFYILKNRIQNKIKINNLDKIRIN